MIWPVVWRRWLPALLALCAAASHVLPAVAADPQYVWGQILDQSTRQPVAHAIVEDALTKAATETDEGGYFFLSSGGQRLMIRHPAYHAGQFRLQAPGLFARANPESPAGTARLGQSQNLILLTPLVRPSMPILGNQVTVTLWPSQVAETFVNAAETQFRMGGLRPLGASLNGSFRLGPVLLTGHVGSGAYPLERLDSRSLFWRLQYQGELGALWCFPVDSRLGFALGPSLLVDRIDLLTPPTISGRAADYLDSPMTRLTGGLVGMAVYAPPLPWLISLDARLAVQPLSWVQAAAPFSATGLWALQGSFGLRWLPWGRTGLDARYIYQGWQTTSYYQGLHGLSAGIISTF